MVSLLLSLIQGYRAQMYKFQSTLLENTSASITCTTCEIQVTPSIHVDTKDEEIVLFELRSPWRAVQKTGWSPVKIVVQSERSKRTLTRAAPKLPS